MVILFESNVVSPPAKLYMGLDKHENEHLIRWGWPEDVWFHVDKVNSWTKSKRIMSCNVPSAIKYEK